MPWQPVSPRLATARLVVALACFAPPLAAAAALAFWVWPWFWVLAGLVAVGLLWTAWLIRRQVPAISWAEGPEELVVRRGRVFRSLVSVPYGRLQFVDVE